MQKTVEYRYNAVGYNRILHILLQGLCQNSNESVNPQKTPHTPPQRASYEVSFVTILEKLTAL